MMSRRNTLMGLGAITAAVAGVRSLFAGTPAPAKRAFEVSYPVDEWKKRLTPEQFYVLRNEGTERAGTSPLNAEKRAGTYSCAGCQLPLFSSKAKYESGTGWPSFWEPIDKTAIEQSPGGSAMFGIEVHCSRCGGHQGHVFNDGPKPTGLRYCINGVAIAFTPA